MQALILAAGMGRRLGALTRDQTKAMVRVHGRTLLERSLDALTAHDLDRIVLVIGYQGDGVREMVGDTYRGVPVEYVTNDDYATTNNIYSLHLARHELAADDTLLLESDLIYDPAIIERLLAHPAPDVAVVAPFEPWMDGTVVTLGPDHVIDQFVPKAVADHDSDHEYFKTVNIYRFSREFIATRYLPFLEAYVTALGSNEYYEQVLRVIAGLDKQGLVGMPLNGEPWYEIDDLQDHDIASTIFAPEGERYDAYLRRHGGYWRFPRLRDFCYLVNPYFPSPAMLAELRRSFDTLLHEYPSALDVQNSLAAKLYGTSPDQILVGNGAAELIAAVGAELGVARVGVSTPTFEEYLKRFPGAEIVELARGDDDFSADVQAYADLMRRTDAIVVVNPDNPSGQCLTLAELESLAELAEELGTRLILDESFVDFADPGVCTPVTGEAFLERFPHAVVIKSISKSYGVPGARLGVAASADTDLLRRARARMSVWNVNSFGEYFLQIIGKYEGAYATACELIRAERSRFTAALDAIDGIRVLPSQANYVLCEITAPGDARSVAERLLADHAILVKDCTGKPGFTRGAWLRLAVRDRADNDALVAALEPLLREAGGE